MNNMQQQQTAACVNLTLLCRTGNNILNNIYYIVPDIYLLSRL